jgi:hypothetical protein
MVCGTWFDPLFSAVSETSLYMSHAKIPTPITLVAETHPIPGLEYPRQFAEARQKKTACAVLSFLSKISMCYR